MITLVIPGNPVGKGRPRVTRHGTYTPKETREYQHMVKYHALKTCGRLMLEGGLAVHIIASFRVPKSWPNQKRSDALSGKLCHIVKPDGDNVAKAITDALEGVIYKGDQQICRLIIDKFYSAVPCVTVHITDFEAQLAGRSPAIKT